MCGRYGFAAGREAVHKQFAPRRIDPAAEQFLAKPHYNITPGQVIPAVLATSSGSPGRSVVGMFWGLQPAWLANTADPARLPRPHANARSETAMQKPAFREALRRRRALVPATCFYEWQEVGKLRFPWCFCPTDERLLALAAIYEPPISAGAPPTLALLTTAANELMAPIHHRMPVLIGHQDIDAWLHHEDTTPDAFAPFLCPPPNATLRRYPVSTDLNFPANNHPALLNEVAPPPPIPTQTEFPGLFNLS